MNKFAIVKTAVLAGLGITIIVFVLETALTMALPATEDWGRFALFGGITALFLVVLIPSLHWLERRYPHHFRKDKT